MLMEQESEMLGIMFGDGAMSKVGGSIQITVTGSRVEDKEYLLEHVRPLFAKMFGIELKARYRPNENTMDLYAYSKKAWLSPNKHTTRRDKIQILSLPAKRG